MRKNFIKVLGFLSVLAAAQTPFTAYATVVPTSGWLVGPSTLVADDEGLLPCLMVNQFSNGFSLRISGGGGQILGMALDTRQNIFSPGQGVSLTISVPPAFAQEFKAEAYDRALLMVNTQSATDLYKALQGARTMALSFDGRQVDFVMLGVRDGLDRIEKCYKPGAKTAAPAREQAAAPVTPSNDAAKPGMRTAVGGQELGAGSAAPVTAGNAPASQESVAAAYRRLVEQETGQTMPPPRGGAKKANDLGLTENAAPQAAQTEQAPPAASVPTAQSRLAKMLERAETGVKEPDAQATPEAQPPAAAQGAAPKLQAAPAAQGAQRALTQQESMTQDWLARRTPTPPRQVQVPGTQAPALNQSDKVAPQAIDRTGEWRASMGHDLREILGAWAHQAQARLVWQAKDGYRVPANVTAQGTFESAVLSLLRQFNDGGSRPMGQIYIDPQSGQKVLVVTSD